MGGGGVVFAFVCLLCFVSIIGGTAGHMKGAYGETAQGEQIWVQDVTLQESLKKVNF